MCGITAISLSGSQNIGVYLYKALQVLQHRGEDSTGVAVYSTAYEDEQYKINLYTLDVVGAISKITTAIASVGGDIKDVSIRIVESLGFDRYLVRIDEEKLEELARRINSTNVAKVLSIGKKLEILKATYNVQKFSKIFELQKLQGSHALGHVRFSTESAVDLLHAHPFQSYSTPDVAIVHNGQVTNYWKLREKLEKEGCYFITENDSELIVHYITYMIKHGFSLEEALKRSATELDGPFAYVVSTQNQLGLVRDRLGLRPLMVGETDGIFMAASEEVAIRKVMPNAKVRYLKPGEVVVHTIR